MLQGNDYSYVMYVGEANFLQQLYFGAKINENDIAFLTKYYGDAVSPKVSDFDILRLTKKTLLVGVFLFLFALRTNSNTLALWLYVQICRNYYDARGSYTSLRSARGVAVVEST